jgi:hypothetical protein
MMPLLPKNIQLAQQRLAKAVAAVWWRSIFI